MSTANEVPQTWKLSGDDAWETLRSTGRMKLAGDAFRRFRASDGTSHARSLAFLTSLLLVQGVIALVAIGSLLDSGAWTTFISNTFRSIAPGPAGKVFSQAVAQAHQTGNSNNAGPVLIGLAISLTITAASLMGQVERGLNRIYGIEQDRPTPQKYGRALLLAVTAGLFVIVAFVAIAAGSPIGSSLGGHSSENVWNVVRWPIGFVLAAVGIALMFKFSPRRHQPKWSWLAFGSVVAIVLWMIFTAALALYFSNSSSFGQTYGPVAGVVALLLWSFLTAFSLLYGGAVAAQLEAVRAGRPAPKATIRVPEAGAEPMVVRSP
jgi:YihY family inner membrane protein